MADTDKNSQELKNSLLVNTELLKKYVFETFYNFNCLLIEFFFYIACT